MIVVPQIIDVLQRVTIKGNAVFLPEQLDRKTYGQLKACFLAVDGKWDKKSQSHVFPEDPTDLIESIIATREVRKWKTELQFFPTPRAIVDQMIDMAELSGTETVLEPHAGQGAIADAIRERFPGCRILLNDINQKFCDELMAKGYCVSCDDFLRITYGFPIDRIIMNPPFTRQQDAKHILHAYSLLRPGGILVSVSSESPFYRTTQLAQEFRECVDRFGVTCQLPPGAFKESGTMVRTRIVKVKKGTI